MLLKAQNLVVCIHRQLQDPATWHVLIALLHRSLFHSQAAVTLISSICWLLLSCQSRLLAAKAAHPGSLCVSAQFYFQMQGSDAKKIEQVMVCLSQQDCVTQCKAQD